MFAFSNACVEQREWGIWVFLQKQLHVHIPILGTGCMSHVSALQECLTLISCYKYFIKKFWEVCQLLKLQTFPVPALCGSGKPAPDTAALPLSSSPFFNMRVKSLQPFSGRDPEAVGGSPVCVHNLERRQALVRTSKPSHRGSIFPCPPLLLRTGLLLSGRNLAGYPCLEVLLPAPFLWLWWGDADPSRVHPGAHT